MLGVARIGEAFRLWVVVGILWAVSAKAVPVITNVSPAFGTPGSQQEINIFGTGFGSSGAFSVHFGNVAAVNPFRASQNQINAKVPANAVTAPITVTVLGQATMTTNNFVVLRGQPYITAFTPTGRTNDTISIYGSNLLGSKIWLGGALASNPVQGPAIGEVRVVVPAGAVPGPILASNAASATWGTFTTRSNFFPIGGGPIITSFTPVRGGPGTEVSIFGLNFFNGNTAVFFGTNAATQVVFVSANGTQVNAKAPANVYTAPIRVITPYGTNTTSTNFIVGLAPEISGFNPPHGPVGTEVTIDGQNFVVGGTTVRLNGTNVASVTVTSDTQLKARVQANASSGVFTVATAFGTNSSSSNFVVTGRAPLISSFNPPNGTIGTSVAIHGENLIDVTNVTFGGVRSLSFQATSPSQITAVVPVGASNGPVSVRNPYGVATTTTNFHLPPIISSLNPTSAPLGGTITVAGTNLSGATEVRFHGQLANFTVVNNGAVTAVVPLTATNGFVTILTPGGVTNSPAPFIIMPSADLAVSIALDRDPSVVNEILLLSASVTNKGPNTASNVVLSIEKPFFFQILSASATAGTASTNSLGGSVALTALPKGSVLTLTLRCKALSAAATEIGAEVTSTTADLITSNNEVNRFVTTIAQPPELDIFPAGEAGVALRWSLTYSNFTVERSTNMPSGGNWVALTNSPSVVSNGFQMTRQATNGTEFFRLIRAAP